MMSEKPVIFISHAARADKQLAEVLKTSLGDSLVTVQPEIFVSSRPDAIDIGDRWFDTVIEKLDRADALIVLITPSSIERSWVWFELGYFWSKARDHIYPLYIPQVKAVPHPLSELQAKLISDISEFDVFLEKLHAQFGIDDNDAGAFDMNPIIASVDSYDMTKEVSKISINLTDEDIKGLLRNYLRNEYKLGNHILYAQLDSSLTLPTGTSMTYLKELAEEANWLIQRETENGISFEMDRTLKRGRPDFSR